jgi:hypothetical protein
MSDEFFPPRPESRPAIDAYMLPGRFASNGELR